MTREVSSRVFFFLLDAEVLGKAPLTIFKEPISASSFLSLDWSFFWGQHLNTFEYCTFWSEEKLADGCALCARSWLKFLPGFCATCISSLSKPLSEAKQTWRLRHRRQRSSTWTTTARESLSSTALNTYEFIQTHRNYYEFIWIYMNSNESL